jgi:hypothetical protein
VVTDAGLERPGAISAIAARLARLVGRLDSTGLVWLAGLAPFVLLGAVRAGWFAEGDTFWQIPTGNDILARHTIFLTDTFSWTVPGRPWHTNEWLFDVLLAAAYNVAGPLGLAAFTVMLLTSLGAGLTAVAARLSVRPWPLLVTFTLFLLPLVGWLSTRPQTLTYALLPLTLLLATGTALSRGRRLALGLLGLYVLTAAWTNLHLASLGALPAVGAGLAAVVVAHRGAWRRLLPAGAAVLGAVLLGCCTSPLGIGALTSALATRGASTHVVVEWSPLWQASGSAMLGWIGAALAVALAGAAWGRRPQDPLLAMSTASAAALLLLGVSAVRFAPMALTAALPAAAAWASGLDWASGRLRPRLAFVGTGSTVGLLAALLIIAGERLPYLGQPSPAGYPASATVDALPAGCRVLDEYGDGGDIILRRQADGVRVAMDGRNDVYGAALIAHLQGMIMGRPGALAELHRDHVGCLLLDPDRPLIQQARAAGWKTRAQDDNRILLVDPSSQFN